MTEAEFHYLAAKVLAAEASAEERATLEEAMAREPRWREEFAELSAAWAMVKEAGPLADALDARPAPAPRSRVDSWMAAVKQELSPAGKAEPIPEAPPRTTDSRSGWAWFRAWIRTSPGALTAMFLALAVLVILWQRPRARDLSEPVAYVVAGNAPVELLRRGEAAPTLIRSTAPLRKGDAIRLTADASVTVITPHGAEFVRGPGTFPMGTPRSPAMSSNAVPGNSASALMQVALFQPPARMDNLLVTTRSGQGIAVYSPSGFTADPTPMILWKSAPESSYTVTIADEFSSAAPPFRATGVTSPLQFTNAWPGRALAPDGLYRLTIAEAGHPLASAEITFRTLARTNEAESARATDSLVAAYEMLTANPPRFGDALARLLVLPPETAESELALRLKLFAFARLGYHDDFQAALRRLNPGTNLAR